MPRDDNRHETGFTLLEVLIAFIIAALALGALTRGVAAGLQSTVASAHYQEALSRARSRLAALRPAIHPGTFSGDDGGGFSWRTVVVPEATTPPPQGGAAPSRAKRAALLAVSVTVAWRMDGGERSVVLATKRLVEATPEPP